MQTFPFVFFHNVLSKNHSGFHRGEEKSGQAGRIRIGNFRGFLKGLEIRHSPPQAGRRPGR